MNNAYPADELMPLSCQGRFRGVTPSRGDMDDVLGKYDRCFNYSNEFIEVRSLLSMQKSIADVVRNKATSE